MLINTADKLFERSTVQLLETYVSGGCKIYKILLSINRYESNKFSPLAMDNIIMTLFRHNKRHTICFNVLRSTSSRCLSMFETYKEGLGEYEFADYIIALHNHTERIAAALGLDGYTVRVARREAWSNPVLAMN